MTLSHIQVVSVPVSDQERAKSFYSEVLGFETINDAPFGEGQRWVDLRPPGAQTSVALVTWFETMPPGSAKGLVLATDDLAGDHERLQARGVRFQGGIEHAPWGSFIMFDDPDGNGWVLQGAPGS